MKIVVCVKQVPDTWAEKRLDPTDRTLDRSSGDQVINELDEYAVEEGLRLAEAHPGSEVTVLTMGPAGAAEALKKGLQMGADRAVHVCDDALHGSDAPGTSAVLAAAVSRLAPDLVLFGAESTDARMSVLPAMVAERLGWPQCTRADRVEVDEGAATLRVSRVTETGHDRLDASLPAVVSVVEKINEPRYPSFKGIMAAKKKPVEVLGLADLGVDPATVGLAGAWTAVRDVTPRPPRQGGTIVKDEGDGGVRLAEFLAAEKFI